MLGSPDPEAEKPTPAGLRMTGEYGTQAAFDIEFRPEGAVVGCGDVTSLRPYTVGVQGGRVMVNVENGPSSFTLQLGTDGKLSGSGTVRVEGRRATGTGQDGSLSFEPRSASCQLGVIAPAAGQVAQAELGAATARGSTNQPAATTPTGTPGPAAAGIGMPAPGKGAVFQLAGGNALAGQTFLLLDVPLDNVVREAGVAAAGRPGHKVLELTCTTVAGKADCAKILKALGGHTVATLRADAAGTAQTPELPTNGTYYLFGSALSMGKKMTWHLPLVAKAGWTKVSVSAANAVP